ncbi:MAG TPA: NAD(P)H-dependent oxidoreductase, partial [Chroococcales cyanobacterium]
MGDFSVSRRLSGEFAQAWLSANPGGEVIYRDLYAVDIPPVSAEHVAAAYTPAEQRTEEQKAILALSDKLCDEL